MFQYGFEPVGWIKVTRTLGANFEAQEAPQEAFLELVLGFMLKSQHFEK